MADLLSVDPANLLNQLKWRYATKAFDAGRVVAPEIWAALEEALILTPSSFGLQPWRFIVITDLAMREKLIAHSWGQKQVVQCSHYVVFATLKKICEADIDAYLVHSAEVTGRAFESMKGYRNVMVSDLIHGQRGQVAAEWAARQAYIALGNFMTAAAILQVDTCPMEGFSPTEYDKLLGLEACGLTAAVCCAAGYRSPDDKYAHAPKVRFPADKLIQRI